MQTFFSSLHFLFFLVLIAAPSAFSAHTTAKTPLSSVPLNMLTTEVIPPLVRSKDLRVLGSKKPSTHFAYNRYFNENQGLILAVTIQNFGRQGAYANQIAQLQSQSLNSGDHLGGLNFMAGFTYRRRPHPSSPWWMQVDGGPGLYRLTGLQAESTNRFLFSLNQRYAFSYQTPFKLSEFDSTSLQIGPTLSHLWIRPTTFRGVRVGGHELSLGLHLKFLFTL